MSDPNRDSLHDQIAFVLHRRPLSFNALYPGEDRHHEDSDPTSAYLVDELWYDSE